MMFVELHYNDIPYMLNLDMIISIVPAAGKTKTKLFPKDGDEPFICDETYADIRKKLQKAH